VDARLAQDARPHGARNKRGERYEDTKRHYREDVLWLSGVVEILG
jgi:hypothetical protein